MGGVTVTVTVTVTATVAATAKATVTAIGTVKTKRKETKKTKRLWVHNNDGNESLMDDSQNDSVANDKSRVFSNNDR